MQGDTPDYFCWPDFRTFNFAEAKGTAYSIGFHTAQFASWRQQFDRVQVVHQDGRIFAVKGFIVATRIVSEGHSNAVHSTLLAEDPKTRGESELSGSDETRIGEATIAGHYAQIMDKLRLPLLSAALRGGFTLSEDAKVRVGVWECLIPPERGVHFVGGFTIHDYNSEYIASHFRYGLPWPPHEARLCLNFGELTFFGLELSLFKAIRVMTLVGRNAAREVRAYDNREHRPAGFSILRDGTVLASTDYFRLRGIEEL